MKYKNLSESSLIKKSQKGDTEAFGELVDRSKGYLTGWAMKKTLCEHKAEEIVQITYIKCWNKIKKFEGKCKFKTWACSVAKNLFIDHWRKEQKKRVMSLEEVEDAYLYSRWENNKAFENLKNEDLKKALFCVLDNLPKIHKDVLVCFAIEDMTYKEISKKLNCSIGTVMSRLFYARKKAQSLISSATADYDY
ncbi:MAG: hypothetical protein CMI54_05795 [Parcubacteria group bacterium]|nr:hypothetical protein [Parcubacteria group bacterium]|tara:strand:- start:7017 stop:7595 length:579 start_codon:yes stop_codon:yes gene_type:complete